MSVDYNELMAMDRNKVLERCEKDIDLFFAIFHIYKQYFTENDLLNLVHISSIRNFLMIYYLAEDYEDLIRTLEAHKIHKELQLLLDKKKKSKDKNKI